MDRFFIMPPVAAGLGAVMALIALTAPFSNTGVDGTLGAGLALLGTVATLALIGLARWRRSRRRWCWRAWPRR